jgi:hypothetical protein
MWDLIYIFLLQIVSYQFADTHAFRSVNGGNVMGPATSSFFVTG